MGGRDRPIVYFFFFSSRRRHTRFDCDWSSDVCSSDLESEHTGSVTPASPATRKAWQRHPPKSCALRGHERHGSGRSEEHTSELQSQSNLVCRLLLEKKKKNRTNRTITGS